eukprot:887841-Pelagomonas_calceolata.AAC.4
MERRTLFLACYAKLKHIEGRSQRMWWQSQHLGMWGLQSVQVSQGCKDCSCGGLGGTSSPQLLKMKGQVNRKGLKRMRRVMANEPTGVFEMKVVRTTRMYRSREEE